MVWVHPSPADKYSQLIPVQTLAVSDLPCGSHEAASCLKFDSCIFLMPTPLAEDPLHTNEPLIFSFGFATSAELQQGWPFLYVVNTYTISTGSGMGVHEAGCLPVAQLFTNRQIL